MPSTPPPPVALRTYTAIRMGVVAVILALGFAVWRDFAHSPDGCVQRSLSAYYYTPVRPVFVGSMLILGFAMVVMWGMTPLEDAVLNLAGLLLTVVAFVPTLDASYCSVPRELRGHVPDAETRKIADDTLITANADTVARSFTALLFVLALILVFIAAAGVKWYLSHAEDGPFTKPTTIAYVASWALAAATGVIYLVLFQDADNPDSAFNHQVHGWSANIAVLFVIVAVISAAVSKAGSHEGNKTRWAWFYALVALAMVLTVAVIKGGDRIGLFPRGGWTDEHATFLLEAILIALLGVFWTLQTIDRRNMGAPTYGGLLRGTPTYAKGGKGTGSSELETTIPAGDGGTEARG